MRSLKLAPSVSEARLSSVLDTATDGILVTDEQARILTFNRACELLFGYASSEVLGAPVQTILPPENGDPEDRRIWTDVHVRLCKITGAGHEVKGRHRDGTIFPVELSVGEALTPEGRQFIGILHDLRSKVEAEQRVNDLQSEILRVARGSATNEMGIVLAHELNQPLTALTLYLRAVERLSVQPAAELPETAVAILEKALHEAERAGNIIRCMRRFVERRAPTRQLVDLNVLVAEAVELTLLASPTATQVERELAPDLPPVPVDPVQIQQIVVNLVRNALEAVKDQGAPEVRIGTRQVAGAVTLTVQDSGPGIPAHVAPQIFQAFSSSKRNGLGLGLVISRAIAQNHGGDLTVEVGGDGKGATFMLHLPISSPVLSP